MLKRALKALVASEAGRTHLVSIDSSHAAVLVVGDEEAVHGVCDHVDDVIFCVSEDMALHLPCLAC